MSKTKNTIVFFDDYMLREYSGVRKRLFYPEKFHYIPTENPNEIGGQMVYDPVSLKYLLYRKAIVPVGDGSTPFKVYESTNLEDWNSKHILENFSSTKISSPFITWDRFEPDPAFRFKCCYIKKEGKDAFGQIATSRNGIDWSFDNESSFCSHNSDTANNVFYNPVYSGYQLQLRAGFVERRVFCVSSGDMKVWSKPKCLMMPGPSDEPCTEYYGLIAMPQEGYFLGYLWKYLPPMHDTPKHKMAGKADTYLVYSYDGNCWNFADSRPLVSRPLPPEHGCMCIYLSGLAENEKEWVISGDIRRVDHACGAKSVYPDSVRPKIAREEGFAATGIYKIRKEGFAALETLAMEAQITLKRIVLTGPDLFININSSCRWAKFRIRDENGIIPGFSYDDCIEFKESDDTRHRPDWIGKSIEELAGESITVQIKMYASLLYSVSGDFYVQPGDKPTISLGNTDNA